MLSLACSPGHSDQNGETPARPPSQIPYSPLRIEGAVIPFWYLKQDHPNVSLKLSYSLIFQLCLTKTNQLYIFTLMWIKYLDKESTLQTSALQEDSNKPDTRTELTVFYQLVYFLRDPERTVLSCVSTSEGLGKTVVKCLSRPG